MNEDNLIIAYYPSPIGILKIEAGKEKVLTISYMNDEVDFSIEKSNEKSSIPGRLAAMCIAQLEEYFAGTRQVFDLPFSQPGTDFQQKVWNALCDIPYGKTISYLELSRWIGNEKAIRAVGTTNGKNQLNIVVPCHRVIGSNGKLVGYGGGLWRKKWLLDHESRLAFGVQRLGDW